LVFQRYTPEDGRDEMWEVMAPEALRTLHGHSGADGGPFGVDFSPDGQLLASAGPDGVLLWDARSGRKVGVLPRGPVDTPLFQPDGAGLFVFVGGGPGPGGIRYPIAAPREGEYHFGPAVDVMADRRGRRVAWSRAGPQFVDQRTLKAPPGAGAARVFEVKTSFDGRWVAKSLVGDAGAHTIHVWDRGSGALVRSFGGSGRPVIRFSDDSRWLAAASASECRFWSCGSWELRHRLVYDGPPVEVAFTNDGSVAAVPVSRTVIRLIDLNAGTELASLEAPRSRSLNGLRFSPDGSQLAVAATGLEVHVWDLRAVRERLAALGLDWPRPAFAPVTHAGAAAPLKVVVEPAAAGPAANP
jgi:WD40 repeat protein